MPWARARHLLPDVVSGDCDAPFVGEFTPGFSVACILGWLEDVLLLRDSGGSSGGGGVTPEVSVRGRYLTASIRAGGAGCVRAANRCDCRRRPRWPERWLEEAYPVVVGGLRVCRSSGHVDVPGFDRDLYRVVIEFTAGQRLATAENNGA